MSRSGEKNERVVPSPSASPIDRRLNRIPQIAARRRFVTGPAAAT
jgi:hypothetical protein